MNLTLELETLLQAGLIHLAKLEPDIEYLFRHSMVQEVAYGTLLSHDRRRLHRAVGEALEQVYPDRIDDWAALLAYHFDHAGDHERALHYYVIAGDAACGRFANLEAVAQYTRAIEVAQHGANPIARPYLHRARGQVREFMGHFEQAHDDYLIALREAQRMHKRHEQWQVLMKLGGLWASRDYRQSDQYFHHALDLARAMDDPLTLGHSLNRVGNWHVNVEQPREALEHHHEALALFEDLQDIEGLAATYDLLGLTTGMSGDLAQAARYCQQAVSLYRSIDDREGLINSLGTLALCSGTCFSDSVVPGGEALGRYVSHGEQALALAHEMGWRAAEAYNLFMLGACLIPQGKYARAFDFVRKALELAQAIEHRQWITASNCMMASLYLDVYALDKAREHVQPATSMGYDIDSLNWIRISAALLASLLTQEGDYDRAQVVLDTVVEQNPAGETLGQRMCWTVQADLALARGDAPHALRVTDQLIASAVNVESAGAIPRLWHVRGEAYMALNQPDRAEADLLAARECAQAQGALGRLWRVRAALGRLHRAQGRDAQADAEFSAARSIVADLAGPLADDALRRQFMRRAHAQMEFPQPINAATDA
jgi:tetratricopeptide (TPR) repeat protein